MRNLVNLNSVMKDRGTKEKAIQEYGLDTFMSFGKLPILQGLFVTGVQKMLAELFRWWWFS